MKQYKELVQHTWMNGIVKEDRTTIGTKSVFGYQTRYDLLEGFPLLTLKKTPFNHVESELYFFIRGLTNIEYLQEYNNPIWDPWANEDGECGPIYGSMWRSWPVVITDEDVEARESTIDQLKDTIENIKKRPYSRRHIVSAWNPSVLPDEEKTHEENIADGKQVLPPCHVMFQFSCRPMSVYDRIRWTLQQPEPRKYALESDDYIDDENMSRTHEALDELDVPRVALDCLLYQRSADIPIGVPFNIASYALLTHIIAKECGMAAGEFIHTLGDAHIYSDQSMILDVLYRDSRDLPKLILPENKSIFDYEPGDAQIVGYDPHPFIKIPVAV